MRKIWQWTWVTLAFALMVFVEARCCPAQASPYNLYVLKAQSLTATATCTPVLPLNGLVAGNSTVGSSYSAGSVTLAGTGLTTATFNVQGSYDNGATFVPLLLSSNTAPTSTATSVTATSNGVWQFALASVSHIKICTTGTFTATSIALTVSLTPNGLVSRGGSGGGGGTVIGGSPSLGYVPIGIDGASSAWGQLTSAQITPGLASILGFQAISMTDANRTLTTLEATHYYVNVTSSVSLTATRNILLPLTNGQSTVIENNTSGGHSIVAIGSSGTGVTVANGTAIIVGFDGTNYVALSTVSTAPVTISGTNTVISGSGGVLEVDGTFTGSTQQNPTLFNLSINDYQRGWNYGTGPNSVVPLWSLGKGLQIQCNYFTRGINHCSDHVLQTFATGDTGFLLYENFDGGTPDGSGEGGEGMGVKMQQNSFMHGTVGAGATAGTTSLPILSTDRPTSDGGYLIDLATSSTGSITGVNMQVGTIGLFAYPTSLSATASLYGSLACGSTGLPQVNGVQTSTASLSITCTATNLPSTSSLGSGFTTGVARIASAFPEQVLITSVGALTSGHQTVVFLFRNQHANVDAIQGLTTTIWQGGTHGYYSQDSTAALPAHFKTTYPVFGTTISGQLACGVGANGGLAQCPNPYANFQSIAITNLIKSGTTLTAAGGSSYLNLQASGTISGCSDSSLNGAVTNINYVSGKLAMTQSAGGSGCSTATITVTNLLTFHIYNGAEVVQAQTGNTPCPTACTAFLEPNDVGWTAGDTIENHLYPALQSEGDWVTQGEYNSNDLLYISGLQRWWAGEAVSGKFLPVSLVNLNPCSIYIGCGGHLSLQPTITIQQVNNGILKYPETPVSGAPVIQGGCPDPAEGGCNTTTQQILWAFQGGTVNYTTVSWAIVSGQLTVTFTSPLAGVIPTPFGGQHFALSGCATTYLNTKFLSSSATPTTITGTISHANASGSDVCTMSINGQTYQGDSISVNPDTREVAVSGNFNVLGDIQLGGNLAVSRNVNVLGDIQLGGKLAVGTIFMGNPNADGTMAFTNDGINQLANIKIANRFVNNYICVDSLNHNCVTGGNAQPNPDGILGTGTLHVDGTAQANLVQAQLDYPIYIGNPSYTGAVGTHNVLYTIAVDTADGFKGIPSPYNCCSGVSLVQYPMGGGNSASISIPAASSGYPGGTVPHIYSSDTSTTIVYDLGTTTWGATFVDNAAGTVITQQLNGLNGSTQAAHVLLAPGGDVRALSSIFSSNPGSGISFPAGTAITKFDGVTAGDGLGTSQAKAYTTTANCSSTASPAVCAAASAGQVQVAAAATTITINTTAINANSRIGCLAYSVVGITPPANMSSLITPYVSAISAGTSFTLTLPVAPGTNPVNVQYCLIN